MSHFRGVESLHFPVSVAFRRNVFHLALRTSWLTFQRPGAARHQSLGDWCAFHGLAWVRCDEHENPTSLPNITDDYSDHNYQ